MLIKKICPRCQGNGFIKLMNSIENPTEVIHQCPQCDSEGEIMIDEQRMKSILQKERDLLSVEHIRKLQEEIDMLRKQKIYLQSKLREKNGESKT